MENKLKTPLREIIDFETSCTHMFDSDVRIGMALLDYVRKNKKEFLEKERKSYCDFFTWYMMKMRNFLIQPMKLWEKNMISYLIQRNNNTMSKWNHRVVKTKDGVDDWYVIHEVFYDKDGNVDGMTKQPVSVGGNTIEELKWTLTKMLESLDKDIIDET